VGPKLVYDATDMAKMRTCGTVENIMTTWNTIFDKIVTCGTLLNFMTTWNTLFLKYCLYVGMMLVYDIFRAYGITK
jgi:hypothetical protein